VPYLRQAAGQAESLFALPAATDFLSRALVSHDRHFPRDENGRFEMLLARERLLDLQGRRMEQLQDIELLLQLAESMASGHSLARALIRKVGYLSNTHQTKVAQTAGESALALYRDRSDRLGEAQALRELGFLFWSSGEYGLSLAYGREALASHRLLGDLEGEASALHNLAEIHRSLGSPRQAVSLYEQALHLHWARQDHRRQALTFYGLAHAYRQLGDRLEAHDKYQQTLVQGELAGDKLMISRAYHELAILVAGTGDLELACQHMAQAVAICREIGYLPGLAHSLSGLSFFYVQMAKFEKAKKTLTAAQEWFELLEDPQNAADLGKRLSQLQHDPAAFAAPTAMVWVKTHVNLAEGKVYCEFESPLARQSYLSETAVG